MKEVFARIGIAVVTTFILAACTADEPFVESEAFTEHEEAADFDAVPELVGKGDSISNVFDANNVISDAFFLQGDAMSAQQIQAFLENTPYQTRSWLADEFIGPHSAAQIIAEASVRHDVNPIMILGRFQVESSHISKTRRPSTSSVNRALGCGCFDGESCQRQFRGLDKQIECAADTLAKRYRGSVDGSWEWRRGKTKTTLDGVRVTPVNHATATLYAYTPWVLRGRGGNWLVWNITKKYVAHLPNIGFAELPAAPAWVGTPCETDSQCDFEHGGSFGFCYDFVDTTGATRGFCSLVCEGYCPDRSGNATTFCIGGDVANVGVCASKSEAANDFCSDIPGTAAADTDRFSGSSGASSSTATVCAPDTL